MAPGTVLFIRHAEPAIDRGAPASSWPLAEAGRAQCARLADALRRHAPGHIASSPEPKALETARLAAAALGVECSPASGLEEHHRETVRFLADFPARIADFFARPGERVLGEESGAEALRRFAAAADPLIRSWRWPGPPTIVAHGTVISLYLADRCRVDPVALWGRLRCPSLIAVDLAGGRLLDVQTGFDP